jgi:MoxR-like ATPase
MTAPTLEPLLTRIRETAWDATFDDWVESREAALPRLHEIIERFLHGETGAADFRYQMDSFTKQTHFAGFHGTSGQMFFNLLVKAADEEELAAALRAALPAPADEAELRVRTTEFLAFVEETQNKAADLELTPPGVGYVPYFLSFFWEAAEREVWPIYYPASRRTLARFNLFVETGTYPERYLRFRQVVHQLRESLETNTWGVEAALWTLEQERKAAAAEKEKRDTHFTRARTAERESSEDEPDDIYEALRTRELILPDEVVTSFVLSLMTKPFVLLSGISGTGKTQLAMALAEYLDRKPRGDQSSEVSDGVNPSRYVVIAVKSDWTDPRGLIGFENPITDTYSRTDLLRLLLRASHDLESPYIVVLDEMNLARVEYYFSDFLSAIELPNGEITLRAQNEEADAVADDGKIPDRLPLPPNVLFIGTVNVDETTFSFSPKVLDRANVLVFNEVDAQRFLEGGGDEPEASVFRLGPDASALDPAAFAVRTSANRDALEAARGTAAFSESLLELFTLLASFDRHFGYRVLREISTFVGHAIQLIPGDEDAVWQTALDLQILQKVLPKFSGGRELRPVLEELERFCSGSEASANQVPEDGSAAREGGARTEIDATQKQTEAVAPEAAAAARMPAQPPPRFPRSAIATRRMLERLDVTGFVAYLE